MKLFTKDIRNRLLKNGELSRQIQEDATTGRKSAEPDFAFGLCDLGLGFPELGSVRLSELEGLRGKLGLSVERDLHFCPQKTISEYAEEARRLGGIRA